MEDTAPLLGHEEEEEEESPDHLEEEEKANRRSAKLYLLVKNISLKILSVVNTDGKREFLRTNLVP